MILDFEQELTTAGGQIFIGTDGNAQYGTLKHDLGSTSPGDPAVGEALECIVKVHGVDCDVGTSYDLELVNDTNGAGGSEISLAKLSAVLKADLTAGTVHRLGRVSPGLITQRYLTLKVTSHGTTPTAGPLKAWLSKGGDAIPSNLVIP